MPPDNLRLVATKFLVGLREVVVSWQINQTEVINKAHLEVSPEPAAQSNNLSHASLTLLYDSAYSLSVVLENCAGRSMKKHLRIGRKAWVYDVINSNT